VQVILYISVFYHAKLYSDLILHVVYVVLQLYGWYSWLYGGKNKTRLIVTRLPTINFIYWIVLGLCITAGWGYFMDNYTDADVPYGDGFIAVMSLIAQWLLTKKKLECWYFWIVVDVVAIGVYFYKHLYSTTGLYAIFLCLAAMGFLAWKKSYETKAA
jgi:nicotinamide mononucleotide transporter